MRLRVNFASHEYQRRGKDGGARGFHNQILSNMVPGNSVHGATSASALQQFPTTELFRIGRPERCNSVQIVRARLSAAASVTPPVTPLPRAIPRWPPPPNALRFASPSYNPP